MKKLVLLLAVSGLATACSSAPPAQQPGTVPSPTPQAATPAPAALDPVGIFDFTTTVEGMAVAGTMTISKAAAGGYTGTITTNVTEPIGIRSVTVEGQKMTVVADTPDGAITLTSEFKGDEFTGTWSMPNMSGSHTGKRRKA